MPLNLDGHEEKVSAAVKSFWTVREQHGVRGGKTLDGFVELLTWVVHNNGLPNARVLTGREAQIPGYFRPCKSWDIIILDQKILIAAIEFKSIADSFGKNSNNRNEEVLGSGIDIKEAFEENAFEGLTRLFTGYIILVEDCAGTQSPVKIQMKHFRAMKEFMLHPETRDTEYVRKKDGTFPGVAGLSYMGRFDLLCKRLMQKKLYTAASVVKTARIHDEKKNFCAVSKDTSIKAFLAALASHVEAVAVIEDQ